MFDDLDDPRFPGPGPDARTVVARRARTIKRNRTAGLAAGLTSFVLLAAGLASGVRGPVDDPAGLDPITTGTPTAQESPTPSPSPKKTPKPSPRATRTTRPYRPPVAPPPTATRSPEPAVTDVVAAWLATAKIDDCAPATALPRRPGGLEPDVTMTLDIAPSIAAAAPPTARVVFTNNTENVIWFTVRGAGGGPLHTVAGDDAGMFSGQTRKADVGPKDGLDEVVELDPGESQPVPVTVLTDTCAGGRTVDAPGAAAPLPPGTYQVSVGVLVTGTRNWTPGREGPALESGTPAPSESGEPYDDLVWSTVPVTVTVH